MAAGVSIVSLRVLGFTCLALLLVETAGLEGAAYRLTNDVTRDDYVIELKLYNDDVTLSRVRREAPVDSAANATLDSPLSPPTPSPPAPSPPTPSPPAPSSTVRSTTTPPTTLTTTTLHAQTTTTTTPTTTTITTTTATMTTSVPSSLVPSTTTSPLPATPSPRPSSSVSPSTRSPQPSKTLKSAPTPAPNPTPTPTTEEEITSNNETINVVEEKDHKYYRSRILKGIEAMKLWVDLDVMGQKRSKTVHQTLSHSHRTAATAKLSFMFPFYGHEVHQVTIATGGFIYMSSFLHQWLTATQYIAPLMANFDTQIGVKSQIIYADNGTAFAVQWDSVYLQDHQQEPFSFQAVLHQDGHVVFAYKQVSQAIRSISTKYHPVKVGLSDAYYEDTPMSKEVRRRTIYEYNRVAINFDMITNDTAVIMLPNPTCIAIHDCKQCIMSNISFKCQWCPDAGRCSDGLDRKRQDWLIRRCHETNFKAVSECHKYPARTTKDWSKTGSRDPQREPAAGRHLSLGAVIVIVIILALVVTIGGWLFYAYKNPTSRSGMWLIEHRPSMLKAKLNKVRFWKRGGSAGDKYEVSVQPEGDIVA